MMNEREARAHRNMLREAAEKMGEDKFLAVIINKVDSLPEERRERILSSSETVREVYNDFKLREKLGLLHLD